LTDMLFQFVSSLQEYMIWVMVSFFSVLFGMVVLAAKLAMQDPMKMRFKNLIKGITKREPETDGYAGLMDRVANISFEGVEPQPLNPEVQDRAWRDAWKDYLIIGLATVIPSISVYIGDLPSFITRVTDPGNYQIPDTYVVTILIFLTWIYRFGYPASNRIAKSAGVRLGNRDIGGEMMRGVLGWFFRLNIVLSIFIFGYQALQAFTSGVSNIVGIMILYYREGLISAVPPIIFAILILPLVEAFAVVLYKKLFESITQARSKMSGISVSGTLRNLVAGVGTGLVVTGAFVATVFATTLNYAVEHGLFLFYPGAVDDEFVADVLLNPANNQQMINGTIWLLMMLAIPYVMMIFIGVISYYVHQRSKGGIESFALFSGVTLSVLSYYLLPSLDYIVSFAVTPAVYAGAVYNRLRPILYLPEPEQLFARFASQFIVNLPIVVFGTLFILYFFNFRESWRNQIGETAGPLLNVHKRDLTESAVMFFAGLVVSILGAWILSIVLANPWLVNDLLQALLVQIGAPEGLEGVLVPLNPNFLAPRWSDPSADPFGWLTIFIEHNMIRTLLMLVIGPIFWSAVLWQTRVQKTESEKRIGSWTIAATFVGAALTYLWTTYDANQGLFNPIDSRWGFTAQLGLRALAIFGVMFLLCGLIALVRGRGGRGSSDWWFPLFVFIFAAEYFVYDDQFTLIALIVLPLFLVAGHKMIGRGKDEDFIITYIKYSLMSLAIAEVLSTALTLGGIALIEIQFFGISPPVFLARILPHAIVEIPTFLIAAGAAIRISKDLWPTIENEDWASVPSKTRVLLGDERTWRTYLLIVFFLLVAALIEAFVTPIIFWMAQGL
ncbi:MAG: stage II sporulation protein M, partial [Promethearchaeota archaeon]